MANTVHGTPRPNARMQVESWPEYSRVSVISAGDRLTTAGVAAIMSTLATYYAGLTAAQQAALAVLANGQFATVMASRVDAAVLSADVATQAAALVTNVRAAGNTTSN